jgi:hypothetical protein
MTEPQGLGEGLTEPRRSASMPTDGKKFWHGVQEGGVYAHQESGPQEKPGVDKAMSPDSPYEEGRRAHALPDRPSATERGHGRLAVCK